MASLGETFVTKSYDKKVQKMANRVPVPKMSRAKKPTPEQLRSAKSAVKAKKARALTSGTVTSAKAAGKRLGPAAPGVIAAAAKGRETLKKAAAVKAEAQRRGMAATREQAPARRKAARDAKYRTQDAMMAANQKKWAKANKKGMN